MAHKRKANRRILLMMIDAIISMCCAVISYFVIGTVGQECTGMMVGCIIAYLPVCVLVAMVLAKGYRTSLKKTNVYDFFRYAKALAIGIVLYLSIDLVMRYSLLVVCKLFAIVLAFVCMMIARIIYYSMNVRADNNGRIAIQSSVEYLEELNLVNSKDEVADSDDREQQDKIKIQSVNKNRNDNKKKVKHSKVKKTRQEKKLERLEKKRRKKMNKRAYVSNKEHARPLDIESLFTENAYKQVTLERDACEYFSDKTVLITGAAGTIGSNLYKQMLNLDVKRIVGVDIYENALYELERSVEKIESKSKKFYEVASVRDQKKMNEIFAKYRPDIVFHAAAHKHVPLMEKNPEEAVKNNVFGTFTCAKLADIYNVNKFILISTDKAHKPISAMGATKRIGEMIMQYMAGKSRTKYISLRFCNIIASNASVVPLMCREIEAGGPVSVTDKRAFRYFVSKADAIDYLINMAVKIEQSNIYVLGVDRPTSIKELAHRMIKAYGYTPNGEIKVKYTGMRLGERLYEELVPDGALPYRDNVYMIGQDKLNRKAFHKKLELLNVATKENDKDNIRRIMADIVEDYNYKYVNIGNNNEYEVLETEEEFDIEEAIV
ncbi:MAG: polysaccharide biosynthesis protein [Lachnospiraceae bacterium]|nr:polysaccharide biosynthesis protein [Lachnospiraceae bacterium]